MSRSYQKGKDISFLDSKIKETNIKYNNAKDIEVISRNYIKESNTSFKNNVHPKKILNQITKLHIVDKEEDIKEEKKVEKDENTKEENESVKENLTDRIKESLPTWNEKSKFLEKIKELERKINQINIEHSNNIQQYKDEIEKKERDIKKLVITNNNLKNSLEELTQRLDKILVNTNQKLKINKTININQEDLQHQLDIKEKELKNQQQLINILTKDNKNIRNMLNNFNNFGINENNFNFKEKIQQQYQEIQNLQKNIKEYKIKLEQKQNLTQKSIINKNINFNTDEENSSPKKLNFFLHKNKKIKLNSISSSGSTYDIKKYNIKNQSCDNININTKLIKKKLIHKGKISSFSNNLNITENIFTKEEINVIKNSFLSEDKYENFMNKINILDKASKSKEKEMNMKIKIIENKLKEKEKELLELKRISKEKENKIITLNVQNKELKKDKEDLLNKINFLAHTLNELDYKNQMILKKNEQIKNSIFNIDGIIEAKSKEGMPISLLIEAKNNFGSLEKIDKKNGSESINQSSRDEKNSENYSNFD